MQLSTIQDSPVLSEFIPNHLLSDADLKQLKMILDSPQRVAITTHHKPDADALGSSLALEMYLRKKGHTVQVISPSDYPAFLNWMPGQSEVICFDKNKPADPISKSFAEADVIFCLDFNNLDRIFDLGKWVLESPAIKIMIDHHLQPEAFANFQIWNTKAAATAELVYDFICLLGEHSLIDLPIAECIYAGILTDTGSFRHPSTTRSIHLIVADLLRIGVNPSRIHKLVYDNNNLNRLRFLGFVLKDKLEVIPELNAAIISISKEETKQYQVDTGDTEGIVNYALSIKGIVLGIVIIDRTDMVKLSFRSVGDFDVNQFARAYFEGGGHKNAAGGKSNLNLEETISSVKKAVQDNKNQLAEASTLYFQNL